MIIRGKTKLKIRDRSKKKRMRRGQWRKLINSGGNRALNWKMGKIECFEDNWRQAAW
jgi:hypothetical protein